MHFQRSNSGVRRKPNEDDRILPLINIVFLLLIFFMVAGKLTTSDPFQVDPVKSNSSTPGSASELLVLVGSDGKLAIDGVAVDRDDFKSALAAHFPKSPSAKSKHPHVRLKADANAQASDVVALMELMKEAGVSKLDLLTIPAKKTNIGPK